MIGDECRVRSGELMSQVFATPKLCDSDEDKMLCIYHMFFLAIGPLPVLLTSGHISV